MADYSMDSTSMTSKAISIVVAIVVFACVLVPIVSSMTDGGGGGGGGSAQYNDGATGADLGLYTSVPSSAMSVDISCDASEITLSGDYSATYPNSDMVLMVSDSQSLCVKDGVMFYNDGSSTVPTNSVTLTLDSTGLNGESFEWAYFPTENGEYGSYADGYEYDLSDAVSVGSFNGISVILKNGTVVSSTFGVTATPIEQDDKVTGYDIVGIVHAKATSLGYGDDGLWEFRMWSDGTADITAYLGEESVLQFIVPSTVTYDGVDYTVVGIEGGENQGIVDSSVSYGATLVLPETLRYIGDYAFYYTFVSGSLVIPNLVEYIGVSAFGGCELYDTLTIGESVVTICDSAFDESHITVEFLSDSAINIAPYAFNDASVSSPYSQGGWYFDIIDGGIALYSYIGGGTDVIPTALTVDGVTYPVTRIGNGIRPVDGSFGDLSISMIPNTVTRIAPNAFYEFSGRGDLVIPDSVKVIGSEAFSRNSYSSITLGSSVEVIGDCAFGEMFAEDGTPIQFTLSDSLKYVGENVFNGSWNNPDTNFICENDTLNFDSLTHVGHNAFEYCDFSNTSVTLGDSLTYIGDGAFAGWTGLEGTLILSDSAEYVGVSAFSGCSNLTALTNISSATIGDNAFQNTGIDTVLNIGGTEITATSYGLNADTVYDSLTTAGIVQMKGEAGSGDGSGSDGGVDGMTATILGLVPVFVALGIIIAIVGMFYKPEDF